jgi:hypothetical protein
MKQKYSARQAAVLSSPTAVKSRILSVGMRGFNTRLLNNEQKLMNSI